MNAIEKQRALMEEYGEAGLWMIKIDPLRERTDQTASAPEDRELLALEKEMFAAAVTIKEIDGKFNGEDVQCPSQLLIFKDGSAMEWDLEGCGGCNCHYVAYSAETTKAIRASGFKISGDGFFEAGEGFFGLGEGDILRALNSTDLAAVANALARGKS